MNEPYDKKEGVVPNLAGIGQRMASYLMDLVVLSIIYIALVFLFDLPAEDWSLAWSGLPSDYPPIYLLMAAIGIGYYTYFFGAGQTPGMRLLEIKLVRADGIEPIGLRRGFLRWVGMEISGVVLFLGYLWILIDRRRQGWHDKIAGTYVVKE
ncbi:RDD family protein [Methanothrix harundinacea]|jgi:uncharacterized RDD family membrane protein YckC|uniref:RDD domain containing protein n=1 Tax=Methanothrix harundinacea (strain 6Ac) TaxID=1110509 RepID=G7WNJ3_METH6|nr:RDD family protein [Methanothrix harundinacea]AET63969.1 RDD domain containing protein [Methanothrix harundinacea 6Ac]